MISHQPNDSFGVGECLMTNHNDDRVVVGKDILELLSSSMYVDPLTIYREYIQNSADAIEAAISTGQLPDIASGRIELSIDHIDRRVVIRDNGIGVSGDEFALRLLAFGASAKRGTDARGFRGVGRLAGLGYCQKLMFRSRASADEATSVLEWDCVALKKLLADPSFGGSLTDIVRQVTSLSTAESDEWPEHFFEVELVKLRRIENDVLLNEVEIENYISQVCPVPLSTKFPFRDEVNALFSDVGAKLDEFKVYINGSEKHIVRPYIETITYSETKAGKYKDLSRIKIEASDGKIAAVGWIAHHDYQGALPASSAIRGLRARVGNVQVGDHKLFLPIYREERFNSWTIGEVHILDRRIVPNGRRDAFEHNTHYANLVNHLTPHTDMIARHCRSSSQLRNRLKNYDLNEQKALDAIAIIEQGATTRTHSTALKREVSAYLFEMEKEAGADLFPTSVKSDLTKRLSDVQDRFSDSSTVSGSRNPLENLPKNKRSTYQQVIQLIYECAANRVAAQSLVDRILHRLSNE